MSVIYSARRQADSEWVGLNGCRCYVRRWANPGGEKIILLHGWMDCSASFQFMVDALSDAWDIYALDWRGMGLSAHQAGGYYDRAVMLSDLSEWLLALSPHAPLHILGHSMGGMLAAQYAGVLPERVKSLIVAEGFGIEDAPIAGGEKKVRRFLEELQRPQDFSPTGDYEVFARKLMRRNPALSLDKALYLSHALLTEDASGSLQHRADARHKIPQPQPYRLEWASYFWKKITSPVLWVQGEHLPHNEYLNQIRDTLPQRHAAFGNPPVHTLTGSGHMLQWEAPHKLAAVAEAFWHQHS
ncbi:MAG: alpha/beta hydrolase [Neisseria sp.]|nr:alpha/beta hydrolase [Neisseria sp.]